MIARNSPRRTIVAAARNDADACVEIITRAFAADPAARWMYPEDSDFRQYFPQFVRAFAGAAFDHGSVHFLSGCAAAMWLPPGVQPDDAALASLIEASVPAHRRGEVLSMFEQFDDYHPQEPHWHLPLIGVDPQDQRQGYGSALLKHLLSRADAENLPAYLEATSPENVALYKRHGFVVIGVIQTRTSPPILPMLRRPARGPRSFNSMFPKGPIR